MSSRPLNPPAILDDPSVDATVRRVSEGRVPLSTGVSEGRVPLSTGFPRGACHCPPGFRGARATVRRVSEGRVPLSAGFSRGACHCVPGFRGRVPLSAGFPRGAYHCPLGFRGARATDSQLRDVPRRSVHWSPARGVSGRAAPHSVSSRSADRRPSQQSVAGQSGSHVLSAEPADTSARGRAGPTTATQNGALLCFFISLVISLHGNSMTENI